MLGVIGNKFSIGKETYQPYSAELHYFRIDKRHWSICFERIKRAGFRIIASAVPWNIHQDNSKHIDFSGFDDPRKDLIVFLELAREFGFKVVLRPGPWVAGQIKNGGLPDFLFNDIKVFARNANGDEIKLEDSYGVKAGYLPSYLHRNFQFHLKSFFRTFIETTKNYVHPRGPIFMVELDYETSFGRMLAPESADFNPDVLAEYYGPFLEERYGDIKKLNARYKEKNASFASVAPPRKFSGLKVKNYPKVFDWFAFREYMLNEYLEILEDIFKSYTVEPLLFRSLLFRSGELLPAFNLVPEDRAPFLGSNVFPEGSYFDLVNKARFLKAEYGFAFATSFTSGVAAADPEREQLIAPVLNNQRRFYCAAGLASGFKGLNHYMFVDRDHWYGAPLHQDGTVSDGYEVIRNFNTAISAVGFEEMDFQPEIGIVANRLYSWLRQTDAAKEFQYVPRLLDEACVGFCRDLVRLKLQYGIRENRDWETMSSYKMLFVPSTEIMSQRDQEALVGLAKSGVVLILIGVMPRYDENFKDCQVLANHFRIRTTVDKQIGTVTHKGGSFTSHIFATIRTTDDSKVKKLCKLDGKVVGVCSTRFKGNFYLFSFDLSSGGNHHKLSFVESILANSKVVSHLNSSDPSADVSFQMGEKKGVLFVVIPPPGELSDGMESKPKEIIIQADLKALGMSVPKLKLTNLLAGEETKPLRTTAKDLKAGLALEVEYPDGLIFLVEKRA
ncbi:MAG: beta-galactosidase [Candidatus Zixiibacteriota bacterium]|nr:MAG: beta-galactosidase [candidate division Zixibacteria bacterium]